MNDLPLTKEELDSRFKNFLSSEQDRAPQALEKLLIPSKPTEAKEYPFLFCPWAYATRIEAELALRAQYANVAAKLKGDVPWPFKVIGASFITERNESGYLFSKAIRLKVVPGAI